MSARDDAKANHPSQVRRGSVADDPDQPEGDGTSPAVSFGDLSETANNIFDLTERLRALKRKPQP